MPDHAQRQSTSCPANWLITCEHAGHRVPGDWPGKKLPPTVLASHRGWDSGAWPLAQQFARQFAAPLLGYHWTRLVVDANRSPHNPAIWSEYSRALPRAAREVLLTTFHRPHWDRVEATARQTIAQHGSVVHLGVHSFTPILHGVERMFDVGLLYDPKRPGEVALAKAWLAGINPAWRVRMNQPYRGNADGLVTSLRKKFSAEAYIGLELEVNQRWLVGRSFRRDLIRTLITAAIAASRM